MNLWIRTQDRTTLIRSYEIYIIEQQNRYLIRAKRTSHILGSYDTYKRALEVLDEIQNAALGIVTPEEIKSQNIKEYTGLIRLSLKSSCIVYEMPLK